MSPIHLWGLTRNDLEVVEDNEGVDPVCGKFYARDHYKRNGK